jgi:hypothetical protein
LVVSSVRPPTSPLGVLEPVALALGLQNVAAVSKPVQRRAGEPFAAENLGPVLEGQVRRDDQAIAFVRGGDDVEEQFRPSLARRDVAKFVEDEQVELRELLTQPEQVPRPSVPMIGETPALSLLQ